MNIGSYLLVRKGLWPNRLFNVFKTGNPEELYFLQMPLNKDIGFLRNWSNNLDSSYGGQGWYDKAVRPIAHGAYHGAQAVATLNGAELARSKDQVHF